MVSIERTAGCVELGMLGYTRVMTRLGQVTAGAVNYAKGGVTYNCAQWDKCMTPMGWRAAGRCRWWSVLVEKAFELQCIQDLL